MILRRQNICSICRDMLVSPTGMLFSAAGLSTEEIKITYKQWESAKPAWAQIVGPSNTSYEAEHSPWYKDAFYVSEDDQISALTSLQSVQRGRTARREAGQKITVVKENRAATQIQRLVRGRTSRKGMHPAGTPAPARTASPGQIGLEVGRVRRNSYGRHDPLLDPLAA